MDGWMDEKMCGTGGWGGCVGIGIGGPKDSFVYVILFTLKSSGPRKMVWSVTRLISSSSRSSRGRNCRKLGGGDGVYICVGRIAIETGGRPTSQPINHSLSTRSTHNHTTHNPQTHLRRPRGPEAPRRRPRVAELPHDDGGGIEKRRVARLGIAAAEEVEEAVEQGGKLRLAGAQRVLEEAAELFLLGSFVCWCVGWAGGGLGERGACQSRSIDPADQTTHQPPNATARTYLPSPSRPPWPCTRRSTPPAWAAAAAGTPPRATAPCPSPQLLMPKRRRRQRSAAAAARRTG